MKLYRAILLHDKQWESGFNLPAGAAIWVEDWNEHGTIAHYYGSPRKGWTSNSFVLRNDEYSIMRNVKTQETTYAEVLEADAIQGPTEEDRGDEGVAPQID